MRLGSLLVSVLLSINVFAADINILSVDAIAKSIKHSVQNGLSFTVGDEADYSINMGFIQGTMHTFVREKVSQGFWIQQDMDLGFMGEQKVEILIDPSTGEIIQLLVNGEKQEIPDGSNQEVIEMEEQSVTVPAGTFDSIYLKVRDTKENKDSEAWLNPEVIPVMGMIKQVAPGPMGEVVLELTAFDKK